LTGSTTTYPGVCYSCHRIPRRWYRPGGAAKRFFPRARITEIHGQAKVVDGRIVVAMFHPAAALHQQSLRQTVIDDFTHAIPAALPGGQ
jgi:hypothetical protein